METRWCCCIFTLPQFVRKFLELFIMRTCSSYNYLELLHFSFFFYENVWLQQRNESQTMLILKQTFLAPFPWGVNFGRNLFLVVSELDILKIETNESALSYFQHWSFTSSFCHNSFTVYLQGNNDKTIRKFRRNTAWVKELKNILLGVETVKTI